MLIISQNASNYGIPLPSNAIYRINLAWINNIQEFEELLKKHKNHKIFLDLPINRVKPPNNKYSLDDISQILKSYNNIKYFAISNVKTSNDLDEYLSLLPITVTLIPKIENIIGIKNIEKITEKLPYQEKIIMLDHDDLFSSIIKSKKPVSIFTNYISKLVVFCKKNKITLLRTVGVVFSDDEFRTTQYIR